MKNRWLAAALSFAVSVGPVCAQLRQRRPGPRAAAPVSAGGEFTNPSPLVARITKLTPDGGRLDWSSANNLIVFDRKSPSGYFDVWVMQADGSGQQCLTCGKSALPQKHKGNPAWHPSGSFIVFQVQNDTDRRMGGRLIDFVANPGAGYENDLWLMDAAGRQFWRLTHVAEKVGGLLHPQFSRDGRYLFWSERYARGGENGLWELKLARFSMDGGTPVLSQVRELRPGRQQHFYESHDFGPGDQNVLFSGNLEPGVAMEGIDVYSLDLKSEALKNLTNTPDIWDEHAHYSPDFRNILWMSTRDVPKNENALVRTKSDFWLMGADGSDQRRLTYFNVPGHPEYIPTGATCADSAWGKDGRHVAAYMILDVKGMVGQIVMIELRNIQ